MGNLMLFKSLPKFMILLNASNNVQNVTQMALKWLFLPKKSHKNCPATEDFALRPPTVKRLSCTSLLTTPSKRGNFQKK